MFEKISALLGVVAILLASNASALDLVELNDANQAILLLPLSKALKNVQDGYSNQFLFNRVSEAIQFVENCQFVHESVDAAKDEDFNGLAGKIKAILADEYVQEACGVKVTDLSEYLALDQRPGEYSYLSARKLNELVSMKEQILAQPPGIELLIGRIFKQRARHLIGKLLDGAAYDVAVFFDDPEPSGLFNFEIKLRKDCKIEVLKPICKLVRRRNDETVTAIGADFADFAALLNSNDVEKLNKHSEASGVKLSELKDICQRVRRNFNPMARVDGYKEVGFITETMIVNREKASKDFDFFYNLYHLCLVALTK